MNIPYNEQNFNAPRNQKDYFELFISKNYRLHITKPTRIGTRGTNDSCIDHIWSNCFFESSSFTINYKMSDHLPNAVIFDYNVDQKPQVSKFYDFSIENMNNFIRHKHFAFQSLLNYTVIESNESMNHIFGELMDIARKYFPVRTKQISAQSFKAPWLTRNMIKCLRKKHVLF